MSTAPVKLTIEVDTTRFVEAIDRFLETSERICGDAVVHAEAEDTFRRLKDHAQVLGAGIEGRYYVRGAMDPAYATPAALTRRVKSLSRARQHRAAAALIRGWVEHR